MVFELLPGGNLEALSRKRREPFTELQIRSIFYQLLRATSYMHSMRYMHRDIKPENILLQSSSVTNEIKIKLADLGLAKHCEVSTSRPHTFYVSTRWYRSPEILLRITNYSYPSDLWAIGAVMAEVVCLGEPLFPGEDEKDQLARVIALRGHPEMVGWEVGETAMKERRIRLPKTTPSSMQSVVPQASLPVLQLISDLLEMDPARRPSASEALGYPLFVSHHPESYDSYVPLHSRKRQRDSDGLDTARTRDYPSSRWSPESKNEGDVNIRNPLTKHLSVKAFTPLQEQLTSQALGTFGRKPERDRLFNIPPLSTDDDKNDADAHQGLGRRLPAGDFDLRF